MRLVETLGWGLNAGEKINITVIKCIANQWSFKEVILCEGALID